MALKDSKLVRSFYNLPGVMRTYHFLWAWLAARKHDHPSKKIFVIGVTGTKGKTTTLELINSILETAGKKTALLSSLRVKIDAESRKNDTGNSMPGRGFIQAFLRDAKDAGCGYALIEVTSQGVSLHRHRFIDWNMGVITNLAPEHIDWHGSYENYRAAKLEFLKYVLERGGKVFLNRDDREYEFFANELVDKEASEEAATIDDKHPDEVFGAHGAAHASGHAHGHGHDEPVIVFGSSREEDVIPYSREDQWLKNNLAKAKLAQSLRGGNAPKFLIGKFNEENIAVAVAIAKEFGLQDRVIEEAIVSFEGVAGRMEFVRKGNFTAIVDYAHTPESLRAAYSAARPEPTPYYPSPRLICVLGSAGGGRDAWKRPEMGAIADQYCDEIILTDEDPYDEDPQEIIEQIEEGIRRSNPDRPPVRKVLNRKQAIREAVQMMREGDVVIGTGKGSEEYIHRKHGAREPWNEREIFEEELQKKFQNEQPPLE
ncbi:MAG TPA: UDP-N-acetylmuramyl-tripeptide synthetase [Candidatus Paceibacterota bacterium]|nr:UDP-N-acetylmuramyl-tripeptide synthetase [Candidatus Paceibacterota bacterium]